MHIANPMEKPKDIFMYTLHPTRTAMLTEGATDAERALAGAHWAYSIELLKKGVLIFAGRTMSTGEDSFASCVVHASSEAEARALMENDPAVKGGLFKAKLYPYQPMLMGQWVG